MNYTYGMYQDSAEYIAERIGTRPRLAVILGSGLGGFARHIENPVVIPYHEIPYFKTSTAGSHEGRLYSGRLFGVDAIVMKGRFHYYEGYEFSDTAFPIRVFKLLGIEAVIITNAAGGINESFTPGSLMIVSDHIKFFDESPLRGANIPEFGERFFDMSAVYDKGLIALAKKAASEKGITVHEGVYAYMPGPQFETPAEIRALRVLGADAVGMSTVAEVITAAQCGLKVLCVSCISNMGAGMTGLPLSGDEVVEVANRFKDDFEGLLEGVITGYGAT